MKTLATATLLVALCASPAHAYGKLGLEARHDTATSVKSMTPGLGGLATLASKPVLPEARQMSSLSRELRNSWLACAVLSFASAAGAALKVTRRRLRLRFEQRIEAELGSRMRVDRERQDRLLQGFHGLLFLMQAARELVPSRPVHAAELLDRALWHGDQAIREARVGLQESLSQSGSEDDAFEAFAAIGEEFVDALRYRVVQEGISRPLRPLIGDEIYRIVRLSVFDAVLYARASEVEVDIEFSPERFRVCVRNDGIGVDVERDPAAAGSPPESRRLLADLQERVELHGGNFGAWSQAVAGTEIVMTFNGRRAYRDSTAVKYPWIFHLEANGWRA